MSRFKLRTTASECSNEQRLAIQKYVTKHVGPVSRVLHEIRSTLVHIDVHVVAPAIDRPYWFLFTTGMSALPMRVPDHPCIQKHAELTLALPDWWVFDQARWKTESRWFWPIAELRSLAKLPHRRRTWLGEGHTVASSDPPRPYDPSTKLSAMLIRESWLGDHHGTIDAAVPTTMLSLYPLHADELAFKHAHGCEAFLDLFEAAEVSPVLDPERPSCVSQPRDWTRAALRC
jgi:hypothetical protein